MAEIVASKSNFVAIGAWNPAILQPEWLKNEFPDVAPNQLNIEVELQTNNIRLDFDGFYLSTSNNRLLFMPGEVLDEGVLLRISDLAKGICERLIYTPIFAIGANFFFQLDKNEEFNSEEIEREPFIDNMPEKLGNASLVSRSITHTFSNELFNINIIYGITGKDRNLLINFDYQNQKNIMNTAANALVDNLKCACLLAKSLIKEV